MSLAKLDGIEGKTLHLSGIDILDGSPVLDIKPYHYNDAVTTPLQNQDVGEESLQDATETSPVNELDIQYLGSAEEELDTLVQREKLQFYKTKEEAMTLIEQVLSLNPHKLHTQTIKQKEDIYAVSLDNMVVIYQTLPTVLKVIKILWTSNRAVNGGQRSQQWFDKVSKFMDFDELVAQQPDL